MPQVRKHSRRDQRDGLGNDLWLRFLACDVARAIMVSP